MKHTTLAALAALVGVLPCTAVPAAAQLPAAWFDVGGSVGYTLGGSQYHSGIDYGGHAGGALRLLPHVALDATGDVFRTPVGVAQANCPAPSPPGSCALTPDDVGLITGGSVGLEYAPGAFTNFGSFVLSAGVGPYHVGGRLLPSFTTVGFRAGGEKTIMLGTRTAASVTLGALVLPSSGHGTVWRVPLGVNLRLW